MRLAVLDIGSNTVNVVAIDADGGVPLPAHSWKLHTRLAERLGPDGTIAPGGRRRLVAAVEQAAGEIRRAGVDFLFAYATASVRDAPNRDAVLTGIQAATGIRLGTLSGLEEAQLTFLAARRWLGWSAGPMLLLDIGGGTLEVAFGRDRLPDSALSLPLGAGRLTREFLRDGDPPSRRAVRNLRKHVRDQVRRIAAHGSWEAPRTAVAASKTFQQLARLTGSAPLRRGPFVVRELQRRTLRPWIDRLAGLPAAKRQRLPGVSAHRAGQILAGAIVGYEVMRGLGVDSVRICPWGLREGILLRRLEAYQPELGNAAWTSWPPPLAAI
ncbi:Ppx/GppA family phosphatase [Actinoplanes sp. NPDC049548]|uniref:Ppx/GppA phosphatase family protein n=1 Tax=Actinoplanes sp. NPDC049548 TaxID=3155152 RepID=UPI00342CCAEF